MIFVFPNKEGQNVTYITDTCRTDDIDLGLCTSKECTDDAQCLSNKCTQGHCAYNEANPIVKCEYVRTVHNDPLFGDPRGYKMVCGSPEGAQCKSNKDCSTYNCVDYNNNKICGGPDDSGCTSMCELPGGIALFIGIPTLLICGCACVCMCESDRKKREKKKLMSINNNNVV